MTQGHAEAWEAPREIYERLRAAAPAERAEIVLRLIAEHPRGRLELPARDGLHAVLDEVDLSAVTLGLRSTPGGEPPPQDAAPRGLDLRKADLRGATLRNSKLQGVDLANANLRETMLGGADLRGAGLERADLEKTDLAGASLAGAALGEANLQRAMLEEADLRDAGLRFAKLQNAVLEHANLQRADVWGADLTGAILTDADLQNTRFEEASLRGADLTGANLQAAVLRRANLQGCRLRSADLRGAVLAGADFRDASLQDAKLQDVDFSQTDITHVFLSEARLDGARLRSEQLGGMIGEELAGEFGEARKGYLALERAFQNLGDPDAASWAYRRRRRTQKHEALGRARDELAARRWRAAARHYAQYTSDQSVEWLCDYGESVPRVLTSLLALYLVFTVVYGVTGSVVREEQTQSGIVSATTRAPADLAIFSLLAMTTGSIGIRLLPRGDLALTLVGIHVFLGVALIGLLGFVLGNRIRR
jgi:uncharacterized protein YjbI with pentapeptide repeats